MSASQQTRTEQHGNQVVHVRGDSDSDLEALFSVLHNKECKPPINSFKNRKLPASFFRPPEPKTCPHSGGSCHDPAPAYGCGQVHHGAIHGRSVSSPAQLPHSLGATSSQHSSQTAGITEGGGFSDDLLMQQWDAANKCQRYYLNNNPGPWQQQQQQPDLSSAHMPSSHSLPHQQPQQMIGLHQPHHSHPQQQPSNLHSPSRSIHSMDFSQHQDLAPLPPGWDRGITADGDIYFISHLDKTTCWCDPRSPQHQQSARQQQTSSSMPQKPCQLLSPLSSRRPSPNEQFICMELQKLQKEKERLHQEQEAIACREMMLNELVRQSTTSPPLKDMKCMPATCAMNPLGQAMQSSCSATGAGVDPFLGQGNSNTTLESHVRQNSTDSGLGGMGTTYSLPRSPEDYLSNVDEMELQEGNNMAPMQPGSCYMNVIGMPDMADAGLLDSDHLMSSLSDDIANDLLNEMDVKKMDSLLYI